MATVTGGVSQQATTLSNIQSHLANGGVESVSGLSLNSGVSTIPGSSGVDVGHSPLSFAGQGGVTTDTVVATQTVQAGSVSLHFVDGSSINVLGALHIDKSFFQG